MDANIKQIQDILKLEESVPYTDTNGNIYWRLPNGKLHRKYGPALESSDGRKEWWVHGELHREDGPAVVYPDGKKHWYIEGHYQMRS